MAKRFNVNEAYPGFCTMCHDEIAEFDGLIKFGLVMRPKVKYLKSNFRQALIELSDKSLMTISLCDKCIDFKPEDCSKIIDSEIRGWRREIDETDWHPESKPIVEKWYKKQVGLQISDRVDKHWTSKEKNNISKRVIVKEN